MYRKVSTDPTQVKIAMLKKVSPENPGTYHFSASLT